ncbi:hypothetical protein SAMN05421751_11422 [Jhaorihella thermophila]|uniref:Uncharacterized protein n=2 Tax=Jhaorihella thermophila TaxID=488547 RepID=A0A1H5Y2J9_9RHOB|nr:hypothetical protein SAMN05421751_11422 [Jhaorihella thermophila]
MGAEMNMVMAILVGSVALAAMSAAPVSAGVIERACRQSDRSAATPELCRCIQKVANGSLSFRERRKVAKWIKEPHMAQEVRQSDRRGDEILWERYKAFGARVQEVCG